MSEGGLGQVGAAAIPPDNGADAGTEIATAQEVFF